jgi:uncharacterized repeat protein (TIGR04138 family)
VTELAFREGIMDQIRLREQRFDERAYLFVLSSLEHSQTRLTERRHISGPELAHSCRDLALHRFGVTARLVLEHWGVRSTMDIGDIVFTLVDLGLLISQPQDSRRTGPTCLGRVARNRARMAGKSERKPSQLLELSHAF